MRPRHLIIFTLVCVVLAACGTSDISQAQEATLVEPGVLATAAARKTATVAVERNRVIRENALPERKTRTPLPSATPTATETPSPTIAAAPSSGLPYGYSAGCTSGGCHRIVFNNKTGDTVTVILHGPDNYWFIIPVGNGQVFWILPGFYNAEIRGCDGKTVTFANPLNSGWFLDIKCEFFK
ncbi:MAG: hypothetical protein IH859_07005 [Chloroflexi bacterium]|nr:hypothetical protein [Chloroflexota bacterium]